MIREQFWRGNAERCLTLIVARQPPERPKLAWRSPVSNARRSRDRRWKELSSVRT
jgi:hypothetical protein